MRPDLFTGRVAIIAGGASGIGRALCCLLAQRGAVVIVADIDGAQTEETVTCLRTQGGIAQGTRIDVAQFDQMSELASGILAEYGRIDIMINSAGIAPSGGFEDEMPDDWQITFATNVLGVIHGTAAVYPTMIRQGSGYIVNIASLAGLIPLPGMASYSATKAFVVSFSLAFRAEAARLGIQVCVACPALVATRIRATTATALRRPPLAAPDPRFARRIEPDACARAILDGIHSKQAIIVVPRWARMAWLVYRLSPGFFHGVIAPWLKGELSRLQARDMESQTFRSPADS